MLSIIKEQIHALICATNHYFGNSRIFLFSVKSLLDEGRKFLPDLVSALEEVDFVGFSNLEEIYQGIEPISIDYGIMEKTNQAASLL